MSELTSLPVPKERNLYFSTGVNGESVSNLVQNIIAINASDEFINKIYSAYNLQYSPEPIKIYIDSFGGSVYAVLGLIAVMDASKTPIHTYSTGVAMSAGFMMLISGHRRFAYKHSTLMYHQLGAGTWGKLEDLKDDVREFKRLDSLMKHIIISKTKIPKKKMKEFDTLKKDWLMAPEEALAWGVIDEII